MTIRILLYPYFLLCPLVFFGQNLVPDPGFEIHTEGCEGETELVYWYNPTTSSPDLFCAEGCGNQINEGDVENYGMHWPLFGNCYSALICCRENGNTQSRDYFATELLEELEEGVVYDISFWMARVTSYDLAINRFGVYFSEDSIYQDNYFILDVEPQWDINEEVLNPDTAFIQLTGLYTAQGGEKHIAFGNFWHPNQMNVEYTGSSQKGWNSAYYIFDEISVSVQNPFSALEHSCQPSIHITNGFLYVEGLPEYSLAIYDITGSLLSFYEQLDIKDRTYIENKGFIIVRIEGREGSSSIKKFWMN